MKGFGGTPDGRIWGATPAVGTGSDLEKFVAEGAQKQVLWVEDKGGRANAKGFDEREGIRGCPGAFT